jgi:hypothetical protein
VRRIKDIARLLAAALLAPPAVATAHAHGLSTSYTEIDVTPARLQVAWLVGADEIFLHFPIAAQAAERSPRERLDASVDALFAFLGEHVAITVDGRPAALERKAYRAFPSAAFVRFEMIVALDRAPAEIGVAADPAVFERFGARHVNLVKVTAAGSRAQHVALTADRSRGSFVVGYTSLPARCAAFVRLGIRHIFLGYDHVLFLLALVAAGGRLRQLVKVVSAFTAGHSLTLVLAALEVVSLPPRVVEGGIALTIAYVAFDNFFAGAAAHRWVLTFLFGLIHGFGFANVLREMTLPASGLITSLLSFNLGVEIGQVIIAGLLFPLTLWLSRQPFRRPVVLAISGAILLAGIGWFVQRAFDVPVMPI